MEYFIKGLTKHESNMKFEYGLLGVMAALVLGILGLIAASPGDVMDPQMMIDRSNSGAEFIDMNQFAEELPPAPESMEEPEVMEEPIIEEPETETMAMPEPQDLPEPEMEVTMDEEPPVAETPPAEEMETVESESTEESSEDLPMMAEVSVPAGSAVPGCEETDECYIPYIIEIGVGGEVIWSNDDTAAHTVTSGTAESGPDGEFDSSLFMAGNTFSHTFDNAGDYDYFCMVHPWMVGVVSVSE